MLHDLLFELAENYSKERTKSFSGNDFANKIRHDLPIEAKKQFLFLPHDLTVKASVGAGNWAAVPWLAIFDPLVTESATSGFYIVYLINPMDSTVYLSMNQGTTSVYDEFGQNRGRDILRRRARDMAERVEDYSRSFDLDPIALGSPLSLPAGYEAGHAFGRKYSRHSFDESEFYKDFETMLAAYSALVERGGLLPPDAMTDLYGGSTIEETKRYALSARIERAPKVRDRVLSSRGAICEACGLDPAPHYSYSGPIKNIPLDVHHCKPLHNLSEGESRRYKIPDDFLVLCPSCHRMIHKNADPSSLSNLKSQIKFFIKAK